MGERRRRGRVLEPHLLEIEGHPGKQHEEALTRDTPRAHSRSTERGS